MTLLPLSHTPDPAKPQTHAFVIGVGDYAHLRGGTMYDISRSPVLKGLKQLTSPVVSATAFANWLVTKHSNPAAPLGSVELLLSPGDYQPPGNAPRRSVERATMANIRKAFDDWEARCNRSSKPEENVAIFYFCGHGVEYELKALLAEDFGASQNRPWETAIDLTTTLYGMSECKARIQCYFIDACRDPAIDALKSKGFKPSPLKTPNELNFPARNQLVLMAATEGQMAQGPPESVSYFTDGLIKCLDGLGAGLRYGEKWKISTGSLSQAMKFLMEKLKHPCAAGGETTSFHSYIHEIPDPARCYTSVTCEPAQALGVAELLMKKGSKKPPLLYQRGPQSEPWEHEVETGVYEVEIKFSGGQYEDKVNSEWVAHPPYTPCPWKVQ